MTDYRSEVISLFGRLAQHNSMFASMERTVEGSAWHREANVLVHTKMVLQQYMDRTDAETHVWSRADFRGAVACIFHDVGKPSSQRTKYSEARGEHNTYHGHAVMSARMFENWALCTHGTEHNLTTEDIIVIVFYIEHHMPWHNVSERTMNELAQTATEYGITQYTRALLADQFGRKSDNWEANTANSVQWIQSFKKRVIKVKSIETDILYPRIIMPIAPSGAGKSSLLKSMSTHIPDLHVFSFDALIHEWYDPVDYHRAWTLSYEDTNFIAKTDRYFASLVKSGMSIYVDKTNLTSKERRKYLTQAHSHGYVCVAELLPSTLQVLLDRQATRSDKCVPSESVTAQYMELQTPLFGEFDQINIHSTNVGQ